MVSSAAMDNQVLNWPSEEARLWTTNSLARLCGRSDVLAVIFFGSSVRPVTRSGDLDCLIIYSKVAPPLGRVPIDVDVRCYKADSVPDLIEKGHDLLGWALRFGVLVCEEGLYWTQLREEWSAKLPFPAASVAEERAVRAERLVEKLRAVGDEDAAAEQFLSVLTHRARASLLRSGVYPISRPELPDQLRGIDETALARELELALEDRHARAQESVD